MGIPSFSLEGKIAIITGGRRGIGKAIALAFAEAGADVAVCDLVVTGELETVVDEIQRLGRRCLAMQADTTQKTDVDKLVQRVTNEFGGIDILVNNAAINILVPLLETSEDDWEKVINVDLKGYYLCSQAISKSLIERKKGSIVNMASRLAFQGNPGVAQGAYCVAKAGVVMLTRVLSRELGRYNIRVNAIAPGLVKTEMSRDIWDAPGALTQAEASVPLGRLAVAEDMVGAALFLVSDASSYITGHTILVDGGASA
jgi:NAD(P)-dependent dehydrogenase (short-subunit alcohol dehydrogenase family)